jgi:hypothetical protein
MDSTQLQREVFRLRRRVQKLTALLRVLLVVVLMSGDTLNQVRLPEGNNKGSLLRAIERLRSALPLRAILRVVRLSPVRCHACSRKDDCALDDRSSCPRSSPPQLMATEVGAIQELVTSDDYRHVPTGALCLNGAGLGENASRSWSEYARIGNGEVKSNPTTPVLRRNRGSGLPSRERYGLRWQELAHKSAECYDAQHGQWYDLNVIGIIMT